MLYTMAGVAAFLVATAPVFLLDHYQQIKGQPAPASAPVKASTPPIWPIPKDEIGARKARFVNRLLPAIRLANQQVAEQRERILKLRQKSRERPLSASEKSWLKKQAKRYRLEDNGFSDPLTTEAGFAALLRHVDKIPADLALAQAALESGWGTSRFAREANNYFGQWCYTPGCGLVPARRSEDARHEVRRFSSVEKSVISYMHNLNSHPRYANLRRARAALRQSDKPITGNTLAAGLLGYAETGSAYVAQIRQMILANRFHRFVESTP